MPFAPKKHRPPNWKSPEQRKADYDKARPNATQRGYDSRWRNEREAYLLRHLLCVRCQAQGIVKASRIVDHIIPHKGDKQLFWDQANWQALCKPCHDRKTATEDGGGWR